MHQALPWLIAYTNVLVAISASQLQCKLDKKINADTIQEYISRGEIGNMFASACGRNGGVFVTDPPDGHTYSCARFPVEWNTTDAIGINKDPNPEHALEILSKFVESVFISTSEYIREKDPESCDFEAMSAFTCGKEEPWRTAPWYDTLQAPIRAVNIGGLFVLKPWITPGLAHWGETTGITDQKTFSEKCHALGICNSLVHLWNTFYDHEDFMWMQSFGLNTIRLPIGYWYFSTLSGISSHPYLLPIEKITDQNHPITKIIRYAKFNNLQVILKLEYINEFPSTHHDNDRITLATIDALGKYIKHIKTKFLLDNVMIFDLSDFDVTDKTASSYIDALQNHMPSLPIILNDQSTLYSIDNKNGKQSTIHYKNIYMSRELYFDSPGNRLVGKAIEDSVPDSYSMYLHERNICKLQTSLHFTTCTKLPLMVGGFSLAIDDCLPYLELSSSKNNTTTTNKLLCECLYPTQKDGEKRTKTSASSWWHAHTKSLAMRQIDTFERELGWVFATYRLDILGESNPSAVYWSFRMAVAEGLIDISKTGVNHPEKLGACAFSPVHDYRHAEDDDGFSHTVQNRSASPTSLPTALSTSTKSPVNTVSPTAEVSDI